MEDGELQGDCLERLAGARSWRTFCDMLRCLDFILEEFSIRELHRQVLVLGHSGRIMKDRFGRVLEKWFRGYYGNLRDEWRMACGGNNVLGIYKLWWWEVSKRKEDTVSAFGNQVDIGIIHWTRNFWMRSNVRNKLKCVWTSAEELVWNIELRIIGYKGNWKHHIFFHKMRVFMR